jgi:hypothetical protein
MICGGIGSQPQVLGLEFWDMDIHRGSAFQQIDQRPPNGIHPVRI